jgi:hypothetical protein
VTLREGKKVSLPIGQVKEVIRHFIDVVTDDNELYDIIICLRKHGTIDGLDKGERRKELKGYLSYWGIC